MTTKQKNIFFYHPQVGNGNCNFEDVLNEIYPVVSKDGVIELDDMKLVLRLSKEGSLWIIKLQELKTDELPKIADYDSGNNENDLEIPDGKGLSYKNIFVYDGQKNIMASVKLNGCPQNGRLKKCIEIIAREKCSLEKVTIRFCVILEKGIAKKIRNAKFISTAEFSSLDYDGENISEERVERYKEYVGGKDYTKITKIKGKNGENLKRILQPIIDDYLSHVDDAFPVAIKMEIDGEEVNFQRYCKINCTDIAMDGQSSKYIDYDDLLVKIKGAIREFIVDEE